MKTTYMITFIALASVMAMGVVTVNGLMSPMVTASVTSAGTNMVGHVEYTLYDSQVQSKHIIN